MKFLFFFNRIWCSIPFPVSDPYDPNLPWPEPGWNWSTPTRSLSSAASQYRHGQTSSPSTHLSKNVASFVYSSPRTAPPLPDDLPVDINFWFFLVVYYGAYLAVALIWVTCLFNLYRREQVALSCKRVSTNRRYGCSELVASPLGRNDLLHLLLDRSALYWDLHPLFRHVRHPETSQTAERQNARWRHRRLGEKDVLGLSGIRDNVYACSGVSFVFSFLRSSSRCILTKTDNDCKAVSPSCGATAA